MDPLRQITPNIYYLPGITNVGVVIHGEECILVDSGLDDSTGRKLFRLFQEHQLKLVAIIHTHAHADHYGGDAYLVKQTGAAVYAPPIEEAIIRYPILEPFYLYGASPPAELRTKYFMAQPSRIDHIYADHFTIAGIEWEAIPLPGHSIHQMGLMVGEVFFCADAVFPESILDKHQLIYCFDLAQQRHTLQKLLEIQATYYLPFHGTVVTDIKGLVQKNLENIQRLEFLLLQFLETPQQTEELLAAVADYLGLTLNAGQYFLNLATIKAYLSSLKEAGRVTFTLQNNRLYWKKE